MGSGMPEIGSRISLISKADIRYEGKLFAVDPDECTIALSSVRSYGTEDRKTSYPVPAQNQVYDFILFRGSDIKDIRVLTTTIPNDPAIVQLSVPPSLNENQFESETEYRVPGAGRMPNAPSTSRPAQTFPSGGFKSVSAFTNIDQVMNKHPVQNAASEDESRSSTPSAPNAAAKNNEVPVRTSISSNKSDEQVQTQRRQTYGGNRDNRPQQNNRYQPGEQNSRYQQGEHNNRYHQGDQNNRYQQGDQNNRYQQGNKQQYQQRYQQNRYPQQQQQQQRYPQQSQYRDFNRENQYRNYNDYRDSYGQRQYMQPLRNVQRGDNWNNYGQRRMNRPGQGGNQNSYQSKGYISQNRIPRNTLKFDADYDFEQANSQFEEMRSQLAKTKIDDSPKLNGEVDGKKEDSGNEVSGGEENEHDADSKEPFYDKVKSFFDQISYEAIERSKGLTQRMDWKTERKINSETFGQVALRRNGNYRGRVNNSGGGGGGGGGGYYNYNNRNAGMQNNYRSGGYYNRSQQPAHQRRQYNNAAAVDHEETKENQVA